MSDPIQLKLRLIRQTDLTLLGPPEPDEQAVGVIGQPGPAVADGDKGDITVSGDSWTVNAAVLAPYLTIVAAAAAYQPLDADLTALAAMTAPATQLATAYGWGDHAAAGYADASAVAAALATYLPLAGGTLTGNLTLGNGGYIYGDTTSPFIRLSNAFGAKLGYAATEIVVGGPVQIVTGGGEKARFQASNGWLGLGTSSPSARLHSLATTEQLRLGYDASNYASFTVGSGGNLTIAPTAQIILNGTNRAAKINDPTGGATNDNEARTAIAAIIDALESHGISAAA